MDKFLKLIFCFLLLFPFSSFADTYPATISGYGASYFGYSVQNQSSAAAACSALGQQFGHTLTVSGSNCVDGGTIYGSWSAGGYTCPYGGTVSNSSCINAPACVSPQVRQPSGACGLSCLPPESDNGFGQCTVKECTNGQVLNPCTGACQTPVVCSSSFQTYKACTNSCVNDKLNCPLHNHPNSTNDACLPDPPLTCPAGQHDDGTYTCIADDAPGCASDEQRGYVNGRLVCKKKHDASKDEDNADRANTDATNARNSAAIAQADADAAKAERDAELPA